MGETSRLLVFAIGLLSSPASCLSQQLPRTEFTTLAGTHALVPQYSGGKPVLVLITFSHKGAGDAAAWNKRFTSKYQADPRVEYWELSDFQGVPPFVMKMILHGMRRSIREPERSHFAPFFTNDDEWKKLAQFDNKKVSYLILADRTGQVVWQTRGPASNAKALELENALVKLWADTR